MPGARRLSDGGVGQAHARIQQNPVWEALGLRQGEGPQAVSEGFGESTVGRYLPGGVLRCSGQEFRTCGAPVEEGRSWGAVC